MQETAKQGEVRNAYIATIFNNKKLIFWGSILPTVLFGVYFLLFPQKYTINYVYNNWKPNETVFNELQNRFYSEDNISKIISKLQEKGFNNYALQLSKSRRRESIIYFEVWPPYMNSSKATDPCAIIKIRQLPAQSCNITICGWCQKDMKNIAAIVRENIEIIMPIADIKEKLIGKIVKYRSNIAEIESQRYLLSIDLKTITATLDKLKKVKQESTNLASDKVILQFNTESNTEYLPIEIQIQATETKRIKTEEYIRQTEDKHQYYSKVQNICAVLLDEINSNKNSLYAVGDFSMFVKQKIAECQESEIRDFLTSYLKDIINMMQLNAPLTENPVINAISRRIVWKESMVFASALMFSVFVVFLKSTAADF